MKVTVKEAPSAAVKKDGAVVMDAGSIHILNATVTIAKGEMRSAAPVKVVIKKGKSIDQLAAAAKWCYGSDDRVGRRCCCGHKL